MLKSATFWILLLLVGCIVADITQNDGEIMIFLARKGFQLIEWIAFWR
ncbi:glyceraldehyde-3-phosphate dehydrogenase [Pelagovum pacificum]|uniref:Glyceraldehyde-3-phosphate dehydrogenase n=1 Tax=Pelagovum pacificum TaxID=2588711 RepID=A0A5C5GDY0_9RHOB|nr:glyceraldehyde-3-phosphate dehydrogenase [Pelagovum pacificum]QQA44502.1 glyceraldehyde-3-phosphate dehydrogenase [Pelagovum pacificum]TNY32384.1 glyceraldehyde-3-phosphate dehydrogenase [Pelagovum pacificum]